MGKKTPIVGYPARGQAPEIFAMRLKSNMAEREGFEPSELVRVHLISNQAHSATLAPLQTSRIEYAVSFSRSTQSALLLVNYVFHRFRFQTQIDVIRVQTIGNKSWPMLIGRPIHRRVGFIKWRHIFYRSRHTLMEVMLIITGIFYRLCRFTRGHTMPWHQHL